ncbi:hypothetical protein [Mycobacterium sp. SMC-11]|uniref:hypothetical protein n=1 Tax=Mycobacterium sp. SMC-11 TaxID=3385969 RepID=UPI00390C4231
MASTVNSRTPVTDAAAWIDALADDSQRALMALGQLLVGVAERPPKSETAERFTLRCLGVPGHSHVIDEERALSAVTRLTAALALAELIEKHADDVELGPYSYADPPSWTEAEVGETTYHHPHKLRAAFSVGTLLPHTAVVISIDTQMSLGHNPEITAYVHRDFQRDARAVLD